MAETCECLSGLPLDECHRSLALERYTSDASSAYIDVSDWPEQQRKNIAHALRLQLGFHAFARGDQIQIRKVQLRNLVRFDPVAGPGLLPGGRRFLADRNKWLTHEVASIHDPDPASLAAERAEEQAVGRIESASAHANADTSLEELEDLLRDFGGAALSDHPRTLIRLAEAFIKRFPTGGIDLLTTPLWGFKAQTFVGLLGTAFSISPSFCPQQIHPIVLILNTYIMP